MARAPELGDHVGESELATGACMRVGELGDVLDRVHVIDDLVADVRALHLHRYLSSVTQRGPVDLTE